MKKIINEFTAAILLFWLSMCIWEICSLTGQTKVPCMVIVSLLDFVGMIILIVNLYQQMVEWNCVEGGIYRMNRLLVTGLVIWIPVLCAQICIASSLLSPNRYFRNVSMVSYAALQACYLLNGIFSLAILILYTATLIKISAKSEDMRIVRYVQQQKKFCSSYVASIILGRLISTILLHTGEHKSTPVANMILNILYFCMLIYLLISLCGYWKKAHIIFSAVSSDADINKAAGWKQHCLTLTWIFALICAVISGYGAIANYSVEMDF